MCAGQATLPRKKARALGTRLHVTEIYKIVSDEDNLRCKWLIERNRDYKKTFELHGIAEANTEIETYDTHFNPFRKKLSLVKLGF